MMPWTESDEARPFLPAKDFAVSRAFYRRLGFEVLLDAEVAVFRIGRTSFILQDFYVKSWAENAMMHLVVDDLDTVWAYIVSLDLPDAFGVEAPKAPAMQPWGLRVAYVSDPAGVLWHIAQR